MLLRTLPPVNSLLSKVKEPQGEIRKAASVRALQVTESSALEELARERPWPNPDNGHEAVEGMRETHQCTRNFQNFQRCTSASCNTTTVVVKGRYVFCIMLCTIRISVDFGRQVLTSSGGTTAACVFYS